MGTTTENMFNICHDKEKYLPQFQILWPERLKEYKIVGIFSDRASFLLPSCAGPKWTNRLLKLAVYRATGAVRARNILTVSNYTLLYCIAGYIHCTIHYCTLYCINPTDSVPQNTVLVPNRPIMRHCPAHHVKYWDIGLNISALLIANRFIILACSQSIRPVVGLYA